MPYRCPYAYSERGQVSLRCLKISDKHNNYCGNQYFCRITGKWENTDKGQQCPVKNNGDKEK